MPGYYRFLYWLILSYMLLTGVYACARTPENAIAHNQYADLKPFHLGFGVGMHLQDLIFTNSGYTSPSGEMWVIDQPAFSPGFNVCALAALRLNGFFSLRLSPGIYFGNRNITFRDTNSNSYLRQNIKSAYIAAAFDLKYTAMRYRNVRPYISCGIMPALDVNSQKVDSQLKLKQADLFLTVALGCDVYRPYFKFIPELKFCFGFLDRLDHIRTDFDNDTDALKFTRSLKRAVSSMVVLTFFFE